MIARNEPVSTSVASFSGSRLTGLDVVRSIAMLSGILLHAALAYMRTPLSVFLWPVYEDGATSIICDVIYWGVHAIRLPTFFFLSGFFAEHIFQSRGAADFLRHRIDRLVIPYAVSAVTILPLTLAIWVLGWIVTGRCSIEQAMTPFVPFEPEIQANYFNPGHLWFLIDLTVMNLAYWFIRQELPSGQPAAQPHWNWLRGPVLTPALLAIPVAMLLWGNTSQFTEFHYSFLPDASRLLYFSLFFAIGAVVFRRREEFCRAVRRPALHLVFATVFIMGVLLCIEQEVGSKSGLWGRMCLSWCVALAAWNFIFGVMGFAINRGSSDSPRFRYLADSAYWMYLIHFPIVGLAHIALHGAPLWPEAKMLASFSVAVVVGLLSYSVFVRYTVIGVFLHGRRERPIGRNPSFPSSELDHMEAGSISSSRTAA